MGLIKRLDEAFEAGRESRWYCVVGAAYGRASLNAVGTEIHSELRNEFNEITKQPQKKHYGLLEKIAYRVGCTVEYIVNP